MGWWWIWKSCKKKSWTPGAGIGRRPENLALSEKAHLILPYHKHLDLAREAAQRYRRPSGLPEGGSVPAMKIRWPEWGFGFRPAGSKVFSGKVQGTTLRRKIFFLKSFLKVSALDPQEIIKIVSALGRFIRPYVTNVSLMIDEAMPKITISYLKGPRALIWISIMGPIPMSLLPTRWPGVSVPGPASGRTKSMRWSASLRPTPPGWAGGPFPRN